MFQESALNVKNRKVQRLFKTLFMLMTVLLVIPVLVILGTLIYRGVAWSPGISL